MRPVDAEGGELPQRGRQRLDHVPEQQDGTEGDEGREGGVEQVRTWTALHPGHQGRGGQRGGSRQRRLNEKEPDQGGQERWSRVLQRAQQQGQVIHPRPNGTVEALRPEHSANLSGLLISCQLIIPACELR
ncbi:hypothetical protein GCM10010193_23620 [Kitasatospora atroaurantiaca]|uniref:hypothetical protein n=1 Tax=Kitasatospora atroaurantiaca TaxID=285545 RepID=UPI0011A814BF|nr:hypothetical protein [Kitasatospora atroaurantiaca]